MSTKARARAAVAFGLALILALGLASLLRPSPRKATQVTVPLGALLSGLLPATVSARQTSTGCTGSPLGNHGTNQAAGVLSISMNSLAIEDLGGNNADEPDGTLGSDDHVVTLLSSQTPLNFAAASGVDVGNFITGAPVDQEGSYEKLRITMDNVFRILCSVSCNGTTYVTKGSSSASSPDGTGDASVSPLNINPDGPQSFTLTLSQPIQVASGVASEANIGFSATAACALWDISGVNGNPANSFKILPAVQSPNNAP